MTNLAALHTVRWLDQLRASPMPHGKSLLLDLPPELRNSVYLEYLKLSREVLIHPDSSKPATCGGLTRVNRQIRQELGTLPYEHATVLKVRVVDYDFSQLIDFYKDLEQIAPALELTASSVPAPNARISPLRSLRSDAPSPGPEYQLPAVTQLIVLSSQKEKLLANQLKPRLRAWCDLFDGSSQVFQHDAIQYAVTAASDIPSIESALVVILKMVLFARRDGDLSARATRELRNIHDALDLMSWLDDSDAPPISWIW